MKKSIFLLVSIIFFISCEQESSIDMVDNSSANIIVNTKVDVCHDGNIINVSVNALPDHQGHGDAVDMDGDGYFDTANSCGKPVDCDDSNPAFTDICEFEIDFNGPLFVALADEPGSGFNGLNNWQSAVDACNTKDTGGYDWFLPNIEELHAMYLAKDAIGGFVPGNVVHDRLYWSFTDGPYAAVAYWKVFGGQGSGVQGYADKAVNYYSCRCAHR